jgi:hypothetical protein
MSCRKFGGAEGDRPPDLMTASAVRSSASGKRLLLITNIRYRLQPPTSASVAPITLGCGVVLSQVCLKTRQHVA